MKKILFITTSSLAANPRLIKEIEFFEQNHKCTVMCFEHRDWASALSNEIKKQHPEVNFIVIDRKKKFFNTLKVKLWHKLSILINPLFKDNLCIAAFASNDKSQQLLLSYKQHTTSESFDVVIAHNLGAFYPAIRIAKWQNAHLQLDIEDFYPGEALYFNKTHEKQNRHLIMQLGFSKAHGISYASEGIACTCQERYKIPTSVKQLTIINSFKSKDFVKPQDKVNETIKCVWFSQHISANRGLELVFEAAKEMSSVEFHLIGNSNLSYLKQKELNTNITLHSIMPQAELHKFLSTMDIGLALEPGKDENNRIAVSNKIIAYAQAGLYVMATKTSGQQHFLEGLAYDAGELIEKDLTTSLSRLKKEKLSTVHKQLRWDKAKSFAWEVEQQKLHRLLKD